jgi:transcriptional pleiotropic regulator of transition state genes
MTKSTGIVRKVDSLDRIVLPKETCRLLEIGEGTPMEFFMDGDNIVLRKYERGCVFCGEVKDVKDFKGKPVCGTCRKELK